MNACLTKEDVCAIFASIVKQWTHPPCQTYPCFLNETWYAECFLFYLSRLKIDLHKDVVPLITGHFKKALDRSFLEICKVLDQHPPDGTKIFEILCEEKFILRKDRRAYNCQVPGKTPKGLKTEEWEEYNHWLLANLYWKGFLLSHEQGFQIILPEDVEGPIELFLADETKPLWGMRITAQEAGTAIMGGDGDCIRVHPYASLESYFGYLKENGKKKKSDQA